MPQAAFGYGRRFGKTLATILWLLEDPDHREVWCSSIYGAEQFLDALMQFEDPRVLEHNRRYWANRVVVAPSPREEIRKAMWQILINDRY